MGYLLLCGTPVAELEREKEIMEAASAAWQEHHEQLLQENSQMRRACEENMQRLHQELEQHNIALRVSTLISLPCLNASTTPLQVNMGALTSLQVEQV